MVVLPGAALGRHCCYGVFYGIRPGWIQRRVRQLSAETRLFDKVNPDDGQHATARHVIFYDEINLMQSRVAGLVGVKKKQIPSKVGLVRVQPISRVVAKIVAHLGNAVFDKITHFLSAGVRDWKAFKISLQIVRYLHVVAHAGIRISGAYPGCLGVETVL